MTQLPIKARVLEWFAVNSSPISAEGLSEILSGEYAGEKTAMADNLEKIILCYCRVGMLQPAGLDESRPGECLTYQVTEAGKEELVYIPGHGNKLF
ncbi:MAG: hypothetical protein ACOYB8_08040 [Eubacteriaceae bacterium]|jgi:hypothetical protein